MPYHVIFNGSMRVIEQDDVLKQFLADRVETDIVVVQQVDYIQRLTNIYGTTIGGLSFPVPFAPVVVYNTVSVQHLTVNAKPM